MTVEQGQKTFDIIARCLKEWKRSDEYIPPPHHKPLLDLLYRTDLELILDLQEVFFDFDKIDWHEQLKRTAAKWGLEYKL